MSGRGRFLTIEGGEGAGKSTQARRLAEWLEAQGLSVVLTREPGGSRSAECLRELLLPGRVAPFGPEAEALVFAVARADHVAQTIRPALRRGEWVVCDRFLDSSWAYQGTAGVPAHTLARFDAIAVGDDRPDLTLILDLPARLGLRRVRARAGEGDRFEQDAPELHEARRQMFLQIAARDPTRCVVVDATAPEDVVHSAMRASVSERLGLLPVAGG